MAEHTKLGEYNVSWELSEMIVDWPEGQHRFLTGRLESVDMLRCVNLQSEHYIDFHNALFGFLTGLATIISTLSETSR
jgi:hypothetical protein